MFRNNEVSRVSAVLARQLAGDRPGMVAAALELWVLPREHAEGPDVAVAEVWQALHAAGATQDAVTATLALIGRATHVRAAAVAGVVATLRDRAALLDLARRVLATGWDAHAYLAPICFRVIADGGEAELARFILDEHDALVATLDRWVLVGVILVTTGIGDRRDLDVWFGEWTARAHVPMWLIAAYFTTVARLPTDRTAQLGALARDALARATWDATAAYFAPFLAIADLLAGDLAAFHDRASSTAIGAAPPARANPIVAYARAIGDPIVIDAAARLADDLARHHAHRDRIVAGVRTLVALERRDPRVVEVVRAMSQAHLSDVPGLVPVWERLVKQRLGWRTRLRLAFF